MILKAITGRVKIGNVARRVGGQVSIPVTTLLKFDEAGDEDTDQLLALSGEKATITLVPDRAGKDHAEQLKGKPGGTSSQQLRYVIEAWAAKKGITDYDEVTTFYRETMERIIQGVVSKYNS